MTYAELEKKITEVLQQPDSALVAIMPVLEEIKKDYETMTSLTDKVTQMDSKIRTLQDTNMQQFLMLTKQAPEAKDEEKDDELEGTEAVDAFVANIMKEE